MMKNIIAFLILFSSLNSTAQDIYALDKQNGFRNFHFGDTISQFADLKPIHFTNDSLFISYRKNNEDSIINGAKVDIVYTFFKGELSTVYLATRDSLGSRKVLQILQKLYGKGKQDDPYVERRIWYGREVILSYVEDVNTCKSKVYISSIKMQLKAEGRDKY